MRGENESMKNGAIHHATRRKLVNAREILLHPRRFPRTVTQFANRDAGNKRFSSFGEILFDRPIICEEGDNDIGIQQVSTTHWRQFDHSLLQWQGA